MKNCKILQMLMCFCLLLTLLLASCADEASGHSGAPSTDSLAPASMPSEGTSVVPAIPSKDIPLPSDSGVNAGQEPSPDLSTAFVDISEVDLPHTYTTHFDLVNQITYPPFSFDYPEGWIVAQEDVSGFSERVTLTNSRGVAVSFWHYGESRDLTGSVSGTNTVDVFKVADAQFIPGYVQGADHSGLGQFIVVRLNIIDGSESGVRYALLPETMIGEQIETIIAGLPTFTFWYSGHISMIATAPDGSFTQQETQEVVAILASFRAEPCRV